MLGYLLILAVLAFIAAWYFIPGFKNRLRGWKTIVVNALIGIVGFLEVFDIEQVVPSAQVGYWLLGIGIVGVLLRMVTTGPVGNR